MKQTLTFAPSILASTQSKMNVEAFDQSDTAFDNGEYLSSFYLLLDYLNPEFRTKYGNADGTEFNIPHGSIIVTIRIENEEVKISAPFLGVPEKGRVPLLRQVVTLNFVDLDLTQMVLRDDKLYFEYACPLQLANPYKIYYVLEEICRTGDKYDDEYETKFDAKRIYEPEVVPYDAGMLDTVYATIQLACSECLDSVKEFETNRQYGYAWNLIATTMLKIMYSAHPQGQLLNDMNKAIREHDREDIPLPEVVGIGKEVIRRLQAMPREELAPDLYFVETLVPPKRRSNLKNIQENFKGTFERATSALQNEDWMACCVLIVYKFYEMYHYNMVQDDINAVVVNALSRTSAMPFDQAAPILHTAMEKIMEDDLELDDDADQEDQEVDMAEYMQQMAALQQMQAAAVQQMMQTQRPTSAQEIAQVQEAIRAQITAAQQASTDGNGGFDMAEYMKNMQAMLSSLQGGAGSDESEN